MAKVHRFFGCGSKVRPVLRGRSHFNRQITILSDDPSTRKDLKDFDALPGPKFWPWLGNPEHFKRGFTEVHRVWLDMARKYGPVYKDKIFGFKSVTINDPSLAEDVYRAESKYPFRDLGFVLREYFDEKRRLGYCTSLVERNGEEWYSLRKLLSSHMLKPMKIKPFYPAFSSLSLDAIERIKHLRDSNGVIPDVRESVIGKWSIEAVGTFVYGIRVGLLEKKMSEESAKFYEAVKISFRKSIVFSRNKLLKHIKRAEFKAFKNAVSSIYENNALYMKIFMDQAKSSHDSGENLDPLIENCLLKYLMLKRSLDPRDCATHAIELFATGYDTTSASTMWILYWLGRHPEKQEILYEELNKNLPDDLILSEETLQKLPYLKAVLKESARLCPLIASGLRMFQEDIELQGHVIPANTAIFLNNYAMGRDEKVFPDADVFIPERWLRENKSESHSNPFATMPFGYGPRSCIGRRIAEAEMHIFIALLVKKFKIKHIGEAQFGELKVGLEPKDGTKFAFYER